MCVHSIVVVMPPFLFEVHFWTTRNDIHINNSDFATFKYHHKTKDAGEDSIKNSYVQSRGYRWSLSDKRPHKLKSGLQEFENLIASQRIVRITWLKEDSLVIIFNSGLVAALNFDPFSGDLLQITIDRFLKDRLLSNHVSDFLYSRALSMAVYNDPQLTLLHYVKPVSKKNYKKYSHLEPKFVSINLYGLTGKRVPRNLCLNKSGDMFVVWWKCTENDIFPWSPSSKEMDRANIHIYSITGSTMEHICYFCTDHQLISVTFSSVESNVFYTVELKLARTGVIRAECSTFEIVKYSRLKRTNVASIPLMSEPNCLQFSPDHSHLMIGCIDGTIVLYNQARASVHISKISFIPHLIRWHHSGGVATITSVTGQLQCFDAILRTVKSQLASEDVTAGIGVDLSSYMGNGRETRVHDMIWDAGGADDGFLFVVFEQGPVAMVRVLGAAHVSSRSMVRRYLSAHQLDSATSLSLATDCDAVSLRDLTQYVFTRCSDPSTVCAQMRTILDAFDKVCETTDTELVKPIRRVRRRLFHYLLRFNMAEPALMIAYEVNEHDLWMDLYYYGKSANDRELAQTAWKNSEKCCSAAYFESCSSDTHSTDCSCDSSLTEECTSWKNETEKASLSDQGADTNVDVMFAGLAVTRTPHTIVTMDQNGNSAIKNSESDHGKFERESRLLKNIKIAARSTSEIMDTNGNSYSDTGNEAVNSMNIKVVHFGVV